MNFTSKQKWKKQTNLSQMQWDILFSMFINLTCINKSLLYQICEDINTMSGLIYSVMISLILMFSFVIFDLFWIVFCYNLLYVTVSWSDTRDFLYSTALNQLFTSIYVMKLCMIDLFFLVRDDHNRAVCVDQAVIMIIVTIMILCFQLLLNNAFAPLLKFLSQIEVEEAKEEPKYHRTKTNSHLETLMREYS